MSSRIDATRLGRSGGSSSAFGGEGNTHGVDWVCWIVAVLVVGVLVVIASTMTAKAASKRVWTQA